MNGDLRIYNRFEHGFSSGLNGDAVEETYIAQMYSSNFSSGLDGWYARSSGSASVFTLQEDALRIVDRMEIWNSPGRDFDLTPGKRYAVSVLVRQKQVESADFMVSVAHSKDGVESYENIAWGNVPHNEWTELRGEYVAGDYDQFVLYVETTDLPYIDFDIRDFRLKPAGRIP